MKILFVCIGNSCRSQMAEGLARARVAGKHEIWSAGTAPADRVSPGAIQALAERGIDIAGHVPKGLGDVPEKIDLAVTLCGDDCAAVRAGRREHWPVRDPVGGPIELFREIRDEIDARIGELLERLR